MIKKTAIVLLATVTLTGALMTSGCLLAAAAGAGAGGVLYAKGDLEARLSATPSQIAAATEKAFEELQVPMTSTASTELDAEIRGRSASNKIVAVNCKAETDKLSTISIRVGLLGDKNLSQLILDKIKKNL